MFEEGRCNVAVSTHENGGVIFVCAEPAGHSGDHMLSMSLVHWPRGERLKGGGVIRWANRASRKGASQ